MNLKHLASSHTYGPKYRLIPLYQKRVILVLAIMVAIIVSIQQYFLGNFNNFTIFSNSFGHLLNNFNLYIEYPQQYYDLFLYNPSFAVLFAPFTFLPVWMGMLCWSVLSITIYLYAVDNLPLARAAKYFLLVLCLADSINSLQHMQVNHLNLSCILLIFILLPKNRPVLAAFFTVLVFFIKVYPAAAGLCFLFYPNKIKYLAACTGWFVAFFALPLLFVSLPSLLLQYQNWFASLAADKTVEECATGLSLISLDYQLLKNPIEAGYIQLTGLLVMLLPLVLKSSFYKDGQWRMTYLAGLLLFVIVFNHAAESATYLLAVTGVGLWYLQSGKTITNKVLLGLVVVFTILTITDIFPSQLKHQFIQPYSIRAVPCLLVWIKIIYDLLTKPQPTA